MLQTGSFDPQFGFNLLLPLFAAILLGGAGSPYGAIIGGVILGLAEEWSTLFISPNGNSSSASASSSRSCS